MYIGKTFGNKDLSGVSHSETEHTYDLLKIRVHRATLLSLDTNGCRARTLYYVAPLLYLR